MIYLFILLLGLMSCLTKNDHRLIRANYFVLGFSLTTYILSEALSIGDFFSMSVLRCISWVALLFYLYQVFSKREHLNSFIKIIVKKPTATQFFVLLMLLGILVSALMFPPNNWDSNTYHLPRMIIWLQNHNIYHYPTHVFRQIYQPILSEVQLTWVYATFGPVNILNLQQFFYLIFSMVVAYIILKKLLGKKEVEFTDVAIALLSVSSAVLEASNTKNDILVTYFILNYIYCWVILIKEKRLNVFIFVTSIALSVLTKGTSYVFLSSITVGFLLILLLNRGAFRPLINIENFKRFFIGVALVLFLLFPFYYRNISLSGNIYCQDQKEKVFYQNEIITAKSVVSNSIKNISVQLCPPLNIFPIYQIVQKIHLKFNLPSINEPALNFAGFKFSIPEMKIKNYFEEDSVPNFFLFFISCLVMVSAILNFKKSGFRLWLCGIFLFLLSFVIFSAMLKWQIWHTRLLIPAFVILSLSNLIVLKNTSYYRMWLIFSIFTSSLCIVFNNQRPVIQYGKVTRTFKESVFNRSYYDVLPTNKNKIYKYREFNNRFEAGGLKIGFICRNDAGLFPYMWNNRIWNNNYYSVGKINNLSNKFTQQIPALDYIVLDGKRLNDSLNKPLLKNYQLVDVSSFGMMLFKR